MNFENTHHTEYKTLFLTLSFNYKNYPFTIRNTKHKSIYNVKG